MIKRCLILHLLIFFTPTLFGQSLKVYHSVKEALLDSLSVKSLSLIGDTNLKELPTDILKLKNLEAIDLESMPALNFSQSIQLLSKLPQLRKIFISDCVVVSSNANQQNACWF